MNQWLACMAIFLLGSTAGTAAVAAPNPLVGAWELQEYVDVPDRGEAVHAFGKQPAGLFVFTDDGHVSISLMRNPPTVDAKVNDPDPDACIPTWYCSYFGTYTYDPSTESWTTQVLGGNIPNYLGTKQRRSFKLSGDRLTISETYAAEGRTYRASRVLKRIRR